VTLVVLSIFPGLDVLGMGFEAEGFCVVHAQDIILGGDVRRFHPPADVFDGVIGGDPCQAHSALANLVRAKGMEPSFPDMTGEYQRIVEEARPRWFLRENVPRAPDLKPSGYDVRSFLLDNSTLDSGDGTGHEQMRRRRFWFGVRDGECPELRALIDFALFVLPDVDIALTVTTRGASKIARRRHTVDGGHGATLRRQAVCADPRPVPVALGGSGKLKSSVTSGPSDPDSGRPGRVQAVTGRHTGAIRSHGGEYAPRYSLAEMLDLQGLPADFLDHSPLTVHGKRKLIGNAVALPTARALARAVREAMVLAPRPAE